MKVSARNGSNGIVTVGRFIKLVSSNDGSNHKTNIPAHPENKKVIVSQHDMAAGSSFLQYFRVTTCVSAYKNALKSANIICESNSTEVGCNINITPTKPPTRLVLRQIPKVSPNIKRDKITIKNGPQKNAPATKAMGILASARKKQT